MKNIFFGFAALLISLGAPLQADAAKLSALTASVFKKAEAPAGFSFYVIEKNGNAYAASAGLANPKGEALSAAHLFRIASITKSYVAAAALRLVEEEKLALSTPINTLIDTEFDALLVADGYDTSSINLKHLLSHTAGIYDHAQNKKYIAGIFENPKHVWTRTEQIKAGMVWGDPVGKPGEKFFYSDTGYLLLGHIIERVTGQGLPVVVRQLLAFDKHGLNETMWERGDSLTVPSGMRAHQYLAGQDTYNWDPSLDLYGGGGLVASPRDFARYFSLLFGGEIFQKVETLAEMQSSVGLPEDSPYRLGLFEKTYDGVHVFEHGGFWGTLVFYHPASGKVIAGAALQQEDFVKMRQTMVAYLKNDK